MTDYRQELEDLVAIITQEGASDLHLTAGAHPMIRVSGDLVPIVKKPELTPEDSLGLVMQVLNEDNKKLFLATKEVDFSYSPNASVRFRGNAYYQKGTVGMALRLIPHKIKTFDELNLPDKLAEFINRKQGFFLVVGPIGMGKSTTLAAMVQK
ncbi:MAG: ATPase, T2SS/T4P/T4SS family, partial [Patescibacteria group bacterium]